MAANEVEIRVTATDRTRPAFASARKGARALDSDVSGMSRSVNSALKSMTAGLGTAAKGFAALGAVPALAGLTAGVTAASGALGLLPAAAGAAGLAMGTLKVGMTGFGDAMKNMGDPEKFAEAVGKLAPEAREAAQAVQGLQGAWKKLTASVQDRLFEGLSGHISKLGGTYIPIMKTAMDRAAASFNSAGQGIARFLAESSTVASLRGTFADLSTIIGNLSATFEPLARVFVHVMGIGAAVLRELTLNAGAATAQFAAWVTSAEGTAKITEWIRQGVAALADLGAIAGNVLGIISGIFKAGSVDGVGFLQTLRDITASAREWVASAEGQEKIGQIFSALNIIAQQLWPVIQTVATVVAQLALAFSSLPGPVQALISQFVLWGALVGGLVVKLAPLVTALINIGPVVVTVVKFLTMLSVKMVTLAAQALVFGARMAAGWIMAMGPIGWITAAVIALVALIIMNWDTIKTATIAAWNAVTAALSQAWATIKARVGAAINQLKAVLAAAWNAIRGAVTAAWNGIVSAVSSGASRVLSFVRSLPGKILSALGNLGSMLWGSGVALISGFLDGLVARWNQLMAWARSAMSSLRALWPFSPAKDGPFSGRGYVTHSGRAMTEDFAASLRAGMPRVQGAAASVMAAAQAALTGSVGGLATAGARTATSGAGAAARELLGRMNAGGQVFEDLSFRGQSQNGRQHNDALAEEFQRSGGGNLRAFLERKAREGGGEQRTVQVAGNADSAVATMIMQLIRTGVLQIG